MKILELCLSPDLGGLELYALRSARALRERGHTVVGALAPGGRLQAYFESDAARYLALRPRLRVMPLLAARRLAAFIDREAVDVVHMHWGKDLPLAALAKRLSRRQPALVYTRQMNITRAKQDWWHRFQYAQVDRMVAITERLAADLRRFLPQAPAGYVATLYYGVEAPAAIDAGTRASVRNELGIGDDTLLVGLFGRIKHYKGQHLLVEAMEALCGEGRNVAALVVGRAMEPDYLDGLKRRVAEKGLSARILFRDFVEEPQRLMQACDAVVLATVEETFGLVLVEAMRAGVAVVGSDRGGVPEIIDHGRTGLLFRSGAADDLAAQLRRLGDEPGLRRALAEAGKADADVRFEAADHFDRLAQLLREAMSQAGTAHACDTDCGEGT